MMGQSLIRTSPILQTTKTRDRQAAAKAQRRSSIKKTMEKRVNTADDLDLFQQQQQLQKKQKQQHNDNDLDPMPTTMEELALPPSPQDSPTDSEEIHRNLLSLPTEILQDIVKFVAHVSFQDALSLSSICKPLRAVVSITLKPKLILPDIKSSPFVL